jgi:hypothetical protein
MSMVGPWPVRGLWIVAIAACFGERHDAPPQPDAEGPGGHVDIRGSCAFPLAGDGALEFPDTAVAVQTSYRPIDVVNTGIELLGRENIRWTIEGVDAANFSVSSGFETDEGESCSFLTNAMPFQPGDSCRLDVTFQPQTPGPKQATLHATFLDQLDQTFVVRGNAVAVPAGIYTSPPDLYIKPPSASSVPFGITIVNNSAASVDFGDPVVMGPFALAPAMPWNCPSPLTAGSTCSTAQITFAATTGGCPMGSLTTSTGAFTVPLTARYVQ